MNRKKENYRIIRKRNSNELECMEVEEEKK
jgi:hypothetical protein